MGTPRGTTADRRPRPLSAGIATGLALAALLGALLPAAAGADTIAIPHFVTQSGTISKSIPLVGVQPIVLLAEPTGDSFVPPPVEFFLFDDDGDGYPLGTADDAVADAEGPRCDLHPCQAQHLFDIVVDFGDPSLAELPAGEYRLQARGDRCTEADGCNPTTLAELDVFLGDVRRPRSSPRLSPTRS